MRRYFALLCTLVGCATTSLAQTNYAIASREVHAAVALTQSYTVASQPAPSTPFVWLNLESNTGIKPANWTFSNPLAIGQFDAATQTRWTAIQGVIGGTLPALGALVTKTQAAYWEVNLDFVSATQLNKLDVLLLPVHGRASYNAFLKLNPLERDLLTQFVDQGGILWMDFDSAGGNNASSDSINGGPIQFLYGTAGPSGANAGNFFDPLLSYPYQLNTGTLARLSNGDGGTISPQTLSSTALRGVLSTIEVEGAKLTPVAADGSGTYLSYSRIGDGMVVISARGFARRLNTVGTNENNTYFAAKPVFDRVANSAAKFAVNLLNLGLSSTHSNGGTRRSNALAPETAPPVTQNFSAPVPVSANLTDPRAPVTYKKLVFVTDTAGNLSCYSAHPGSDLAGTGNPDDGDTDYSGGTSYDRVWRVSAGASMPTPLSAPVAFEVANPTGSGIKQDQVAVVDSQGSLHVFNIFNTNAAGAFIAPNGTGTLGEAYVIDPPGGFAGYAATGAQLGPYSPVFHDGLLYIADTQTTLGTTLGRVWVADPAVGTRVSSSTGDFYVGGSTSSGLPDITAAPTIGYIPIQDNSGGLDKVMYLPTRGVAGFNPTQACGLASLWIGAKGEKPVDYQVVGGVLQITTRASLQGLPVYVSANQTQPDKLGLHVSLIRANGDPYSEADMAGVFTGTYTDSGSGVLSLPLVGSGLPADVTGVRVDYNIDWGVGPSQTSQVVRGTLNFPDDNGHHRRVMGGLALGPSGTVFASVSGYKDPLGANTGGAVYAIQEVGRGSFKLVYRYEMYDTFNVQLSQGGTAAYGPLFHDNDYITTFSPFLAGSINNLTLASAPAVKGDAVYVMARGSKSGLAPVTLLLALKANPDPVEIRIPDTTPNFAIVQPDISSSTSPVNPDHQSILQPGQYTYSKDLRATYGVIRIDNLMSTTRGPISSALSTSMPIILRQSGVADTIIEPDRNGGTWSPLLWYMSWPGFDNPTNPVVTADNIYFGCSSYALGILLNGAIGAQNAMILGVKNNILTTDPFLIDDPQKPWNHQLYQLTNLGSVAANPAIICPQTLGATSTADYASRLSQSVLTLPGSTPSTPYALTAGEGTLLSYDNAGLYSFARSELVVTDKSRLGRYDSVGNPFWTLQDSLPSGTTDDSVGAVDAESLVEPVRAYKQAEGEVLVVDAGSNKLLWLDQLGHASRIVSGYILDPAHTVPGLSASEPTTFKKPSDVATWSEYVDATTKNVSSPSATEYWTHYLVADKGNNRLLEIIDRYTVNGSRQIGGPVQVGGVDQLGVLNWHSDAATSGPGQTYIPKPGSPRPDVAVGGVTYDFNSVQHLAPTAFSGGADVVVASSSTAVFIFFGGVQPLVVKQLYVPPVANNAYFDPVGLNFSTNSTQAQDVPLKGIKAVTASWQSNGGAPTLAIMITTNEGVYEFDQATSTVRWMMPNQVYLALHGINGKYPVAGSPTFTVGFSAAYNMNPRGFNPTYAKRMGNGDVLIVNAYSGRTLGDAEFNGEIIQINGQISANPTTDDNTVAGFGFNKTNLGFGAESIHTSVTSLTGVRKLMSPTFADRR